MTLIERLDDKVALISGAASGIGRETARLFAEQGAEVFVGDIDSKRGKEVVDEIGSAAHFLNLDVTQESSWSEAVKAILQHGNRLDILLNSAGVWVDGDFLSHSMDVWQRTMDINVKGTFLGCRYAVQAMKSGGNGGTIVNIASIYGNIGADDAVAYCASKGAVRLLTKAVAMYCAAKRLPIRCNSVHPSYVDSEMLDAFAKEVGGRDAALNGFSSVIPMRKLPKAIDIAKAILFLSSDSSQMVTGAELPVDGGMLAGIFAPVSVPLSPVEAID